MHDSNHPEHLRRIVSRLPDALPLARIDSAEIVADTARSTVIRLHVGTERYYFKRDHILPPPEAAVVSTLARRWPERIVPLVASDPSAGWTLSADVGPVGLDGATTERWQRVATHFAEVQIDPGSGPDAWLEIGCRDLRGGCLLDAVDAMLEDFAPGLPPGPRLCLDRLRPRVVNACAELAGDGVPATLVHQDLVPVNIALVGVETVFLDWSDTVVGHPFFGFDRLLDSCWSDPERKAAAIAAYLAGFDGVRPRDRLQASFDHVLSLRVLYECVRWHHEIAAMDPLCEHAQRLRRDAEAGLLAMAR